MRLAPNMDWRAYVRTSILTPCPLTTMSDLDADLYGDLYGNDEPEFAVPTEPAEDPVKSEPVQHDTVKKEASPTPQPSAPVSTGASDNLKPSRASPTPKQPATQAQAPQSQSQVPVYTSPTTQQIPTYQERQDEYSEMAPTLPDSAYSQLDRPVRPSEMKEEG
ncbi:hypothetical protein BXZ70DRAFT_578227 [Cristinia sonorae]|uniref:Uncharacterized protein n=1 Tax=Cristinia sonorae TaxID=1940300 RepID=A0A8K0XKJ3_9AGAR|nr:hypothetical protein BXZ70DRAFT_578227 [Cristinia sonorae]